MKNSGHKWHKKTLFFHVRGIKRREWMCQKGEGVRIIQLRGRRSNQKCNNQP
jgi:hypothetical protein